jgi:hypothetical protein
MTLQALKNFVAIFVQASTLILEGASLRQRATPFAESLSDRSTLDNRPQSRLRKLAAQSSLYIPT